jgi:hypothetical protein
MINDEESATENELDNNEADNEETLEMPDDLECGEYCIGSDCKNYGECDDDKYCKDNECISVCIDMECGWDFVLCGVCDYGDRFFCSENNNCSNWECNGFCWDSPYAYPDDIENRFTVSGDEEKVVYDNYTQIMWTKQIWKNDQYSLGSYGGYSDWILPDVYSLETLLNYYKENAPYSDFPDILSGRILTSSSEYSDNWDAYDHVYLVDTSIAEVRFYYEDSLNKDNISKIFMRNTNNNGAPAQRFQELTTNKEKVFFDLRTGLQWTENVEQHSDIEDAVEYCKNLNYGGYDDWHIPDVYEAKTLLRWTGYKASELFPFQDIFFLRTYSEKYKKEIFVSIKNVTIGYFEGTTKQTICVRSN